MGSNISEDDGLHMHIAGSENLLEEAGGGGTHFVPGTKTLVGAASATVNRQSVAMKLQLRVIEQNVARLMESREQLTAINKLIRSAQVPLVSLPFIHYCAFRELWKFNLRRFIKLLR
jgi:hypothetical protein